MLKAVCILLLQMLIILPAKAADLENRALEVVLNNGTEEVFKKMVPLSEMKAGFEIEEVSHQSPVYAREMSYQGFVLQDVLEKNGIDYSQVKEISFYCRDGYIAKWNPSVTQSELFIAVNETANPDGFTDIAEGKEVVNPQPFFVMTREAKGFEEWPWPHQVYKLEVNYQAEKADHYPEGALEDGQVMLGYNKFKNLCVACHTVNLEGGEIGPELNIPQNITEYREIPYLKQFIKNPSSFRARSRMMTFDFLADEDLDSILAYLSYMADHKKLDKMNAH